MDGTTIDKGRKMSLCPLQMTLGIFNVKTRRHARAWQTLYFSPKTTNCENGHKGIVNLHLGLEEALRSVREACSGRRDYEWSNLPWNGREWKVKMKFAVAYVIGDTEMHDKFCGRVPTRTNNSRMLCRHCRHCTMTLTALGATWRSLGTPNPANCGNPSILRIP